ncbi:MAG TPA: T9SS type A sorting domain-containing protein [Bacteroidia bacterium]|nr:T9SS type A sorting domain-containing protein [Bacteroidia bacterium]
MKKALFFSLICIQDLGVSQTIVNAYAKITSVTNSSVLALSNVNQTNHTFTVGGQVVIMQMQDDVIGTNTTNASTFGDLSSIANAGNYEIRTISAITPTSGTPTSITITPNLSNTYNTGSNASVQLISFRDLGANYTTTANISGVTWNGNVGGVVAFYTSGTLTLNHRVQANGLGFRGGAFSSNAAGDFACVNTSYTSTLTTLGAKGEGIYLATVTSYSNGRGKILNGGGGGSQNNAGGGGGGNFTAGGDGGLGYPCTVANSGRGLGGISLSGQISASRIFMGGGGGGGQANNSVATAGGNGGGIILIKAGSIATSTTCGSSILISANGNSPANSGNDGAGGGGAGGTIVIQANSFSVTATCPMTLSANGGNGGSVGNAASHGGGAGGGQGAIVFSTAQPTTNISTQTTNGNPGADNSGGTTNATGGGGSNNSGVIGSATGPLPIELLSFSAHNTVQAIQLVWETASEKNNEVFEIERSQNGLDFLKLGSLPGAGNSTIRIRYEWLDRFPAEGINYYRLKQTDKDGAYKYSPIVFANMISDFDLRVFPNPLLSGEVLNLDIADNTSTELFVSISDITGKAIYSQKVYLSHNVHAGRLQTNPLCLEPGLYMLRLENVYKKSRVIKLLVR